MYTITELSFSFPVIENTWCDLLKDMTVGGI